MMEQKDLFGNNECSKVQEFAMHNEDKKHPILFQSSEKEQQK